MDLTWTPERRKVSDLKELPNNPRRIDKEALAKLKSRIEARGFHDVVKVDSDGYVLSGNQRKKALTELGVEEVWALVPSRELSREERDKVILESNRNDGSWDLQILSSDFDIGVLHDIGFTDKELGIINVNFQAKVKDSFEVVVDCATEQEQERVWNELKEKGYTVRVLTY